MYQFTALIYDGLAQHLVKHQCTSVDEFNQYLHHVYPVYICVWMSQDWLQQDEIGQSA